jgi:DnaJ-class molecular chaperone
MSHTGAPAPPQPCPACDGTGQVTITLRNDQTHTDQALVQTCTECL